MRRSATAAASQAAGEVGIDLPLLREKTARLGGLQLVEHFERVPRIEHHSTAAHLRAVVLAPYRIQIVEFGTKNVSGVLLVDEQPDFATCRSEERRVGKGCRARPAAEPSSRRRHTSFSRDWSSDVCSSDLFGRPPACRTL